VHQYLVQKKRFDMFFTGLPVKVIGTVDQPTLNKLHQELLNKFNNKWIRRSTNNLMDTSYCLKAITPSNFDIPDSQTQQELKELLLPFVQPYVLENEVIVYLDVSSLPPGTKSLVHVDYLLMHVLSRRIRIPITTNPKSVFSLKTADGIHNFNLKVGNVYETNNQSLHTAANLGDTDRWHIAVDIMDNDLYNILVKNNQLYRQAFDPSINFSLSSDTIFQIEEALNNPPINI
jgi:hypothetical protein